MASRGSVAVLVVTVALLASTSTAVNARTLINRRELVQSGATAVFIDEIHWDNIALDFGEAVEIFGPVGLDISGYKLTRYAGGFTTAGQPCNSADCTAAGYVYTFPANTILVDPADTGAGAGMVVVVFPANGLSNGGAQIALSDPSNQLLDYLTYASGGTAPPMTMASIGVASGSTPVPVTVQEIGTSPVGVSAQRMGYLTWSTTIGPNTFGAAYQNYFTTANPTGVPTCHLLCNV